MHTYFVGEQRAMLCNDWEQVSIGTAQLNTRFMHALCHRYFVTNRVRLKWNTKKPSITCSFQLPQRNKENNIHSHNEWVDYT